MSVSLGINAIMVENSVLNMMEEPDRKNDLLEVFPNPFASSVCFRLDHGVNETTLTIFDHLGRVVSSAEYKNVFPGILPVEMEGLASGVYHYGLRADSVFYSGTLIKTDSK